MFKVRHKSYARSDEEILNAPQIAGNTTNAPQTWATVGLDESNTVPAETQSPKVPVVPTFARARALYACYKAMYINVLRSLDSTPDGPVLPHFASIQRA
jgi:hypothetical protein